MKLGAVAKNRHCRSSTIKPFQNDTKNKVKDKIEELKEKHSA